MAGGVKEQFANLLQTLRWIGTTNPTPAEVCEWLRSTYRLSSYFARDAYTVVLISGGLATVRDKRCYLTRDGQAVLDAASPLVLLEVFEKHFAGVAAILEVFRHHDELKADHLNDLWFRTVQDRFPNIKRWSERTLHNQCRHRINWLRAMGLITAFKGRYSLSEAGTRLLLEHPPEAVAIQPHEVKKELTSLHQLVESEFQLFDRSKRKELSLRRGFVRDRAFRWIVSDQYAHQCAVCGLRLCTPDGVYEAQAAHIVPKSKQGTDDPRNGICLCGVHHWAFDEGVISVQPNNLKLITASYLEKTAEDESVRQLLNLGSTRIRSARDEKYAPSAMALAWHNANVFLG